MNPNSYYQQPQAPVGLPTRKNNTGLLVGISLSAVLFLGLFIWQFMQAAAARSDRDTAIASAVEKAEEEQQAKLQAEFKQQLESDTVQFVGPDVLGSIRFEYPKAWSVQVDSNNSGSTPLSVTMHPNAITNTTAAFALRMEVVEEEYSDRASDYDRAVEKGELKSRPVSYSGQNGIRFDGLIKTDLEGSIVLLPVRDKTLVMWTESTNFLQAFERALTTLNYVP